MSSFELHPVWDKSFGGNSNDYLGSMLTTPDGGYLLGGGSASTTATGTKTAPYYGYTIYDFWIVKIK